MPRSGKRVTSHAHNSGMALIVAVSFIAVALVMLSALLVRNMNQRRIVDHYTLAERCFFGLEAATQRALAELDRGEDGMIGLDTWLTQTHTTLPSFQDAGVTPQTLSGMQDVQFIAYTQNWTNDGKDNNGNGQIDESEEAYHYTIHAWARNANHLRRSETVLVARDVNVWRNAIFAGAGQAGGLINGNVAIYGSVHLLGNNLLPGTMAVAAIDLSGTALIHNNYADMPTTLSSRIPPLPTTNFNGENVQTLNAVLRVKRGLVGMSGNSEVGEPNVAGNAWKETMDATYVTDGWTGTQVTPDGGRGIPSNVYSDNGWSESYDLGDRVSFPVLSDPWRWPITGAKEWNPATNNWYTHEEYFSQVLLANPSNPSDGVYNGTIDLYTRGQHFYWNATKNIVLTGTLPTGAQAPAPTDDYLLFNKDTKVLQVNGQLVINGDLKMRGQGNDRTIYYSGKAALLVNGNVSLDTNLLTCNNGNPSNYANSFPVNNCLGIMSKRDMVVGSTAQLTIMGAFYAQGKIQSTKQTDVAGTFVSNYFDMGTNVPRIYQVPSLADNLPLGMIGNFPILAITRVSWRERVADSSW